MEFYFCKSCENLIVPVEHGSGRPFCCGEKMQQLQPAAERAPLDRHAPVVSEVWGKIIVSVGSNPHPMTEEHYIKWIFLRTWFGIQLRRLKPGDAPEAIFTINDGDQVIDAYAFCSQHKIWRSLI